jgi:hypothetical protein
VFLIIVLNINKAKAVPTRDKRRIAMKPFFTSRVFLKASRVCSVKNKKIEGIKRRRNAIEAISRDL